MKRFALLLGLIAGFYLLTGLLLISLPVVRSGFLDRLINIGFQSEPGRFRAPWLEIGLLITGFLLLAVAVLLFIFDRDGKGPFYWKRSTFLLFTITLQLTIGLFYILLTPYNVEAGDDRWYYFEAERLAHGQDPIWNHAQATPVGGEPTAFWPVGYSLFLSVFFKVFGASIRLGQILNLLVFGGITLLTYSLFQNLFGPKMAARTAFVIALTPSQTIFILPLMADGLFAILCIMMLYLITRKSALSNTVFIGIIYGFATITRPVALGFPLVLMSYRVLRDKQWKHVLLQTFLIVAIGEAVLLPWQVRNYKTFSHFVLVCTNGGKNFWFGNNPHATGREIYAWSDPETHATIKTSDELPDEVARNRYFMRAGLEWARSHPFKAISLWPRKILYLFYRDSRCVSWAVGANFKRISPPILSSMYLITEGYYYALVISAVIGMGLSLKKERITPRIGLIFGTLAYFTVIHLPFITESRFHLPLMPLMALLAVLDYPSAKFSRISRD